MSADAHSQVRHVLSPVTTEIVIDGAVYSVDGIKQLIARSLIEKTATPAKEPEPESSRDRIYREIREKDTAAKEEILTAFVAKYGAEPDEVEIVHTGMHWHVRKREGYRERDEALHDRKLLIEFFHSRQGGLMGGRGDIEGWSPGQTAIFFLQDYVKFYSPTRDQLAERVRADLHTLHMHQVVPVVTAYLALDDALRSLKGPTVSVEGLPKPARESLDLFEDADDEPDND